MNAPLFRDFARLHDSDAGGFAPGRLWSLWEMLTLKARPFANVIQGLVLMQAPPHAGSARVPEDITRSLNNTAKDIAKYCDELELPVAAEMARHVLEKICTYRELQLALNQLMNTMFIELNNRTFYAPTRDLVKYYENDKLFGDDVFNSFPSSNEDIQEAGTCLALERPTASVLHLNRALEVALRALAAAVGVSKQNDWGSYIREIGSSLAAKTKASGARSVDEQFYAEAAAHFDNLKRAYRNPTMHPERSYSAERAEEIIRSTGSFMRHLATKISESQDA